MQEGKEVQYKIPNLVEHKHYIQDIEKMPAFDNPEIFGLSSNADLTF